MKKIFLVMTMAATFAACKEKTSQTNTAASTVPDVVATNAGSMALNYSQPVQQDKTSNTTVKKEVRYETASSYPARSYKKKGWSNAAKGTVIGAGTGAVVGGVLSKKHGKGAVVGGIIGGVGGYIIGRHKDKKTGRVQ